MRLRCVGHAVEQLCQKVLFASAEDNDLIKQGTNGRRSAAGPRVGIGDRLAGDRGHHRLASGLRQADIAPVLGLAEELQDS